MSKPSEKYFDKVERWILGGLPIEKIVMSPDQRFRALLVYEAYHIWLQSKQLNPTDVIRRIAAREYPVLLDKANNGDAKAQDYVTAMRIRPGIVRTPTEISNDVALFNHIVGQLSTPTVNIKRAQTEYATDWLIQQGIRDDDRRAVEKGIGFNLQMYNNFQEEENVADSMPTSDINITTDVSVVKRDRVNYSPEERKRLARKFGLTDKQVVDLIQGSDGTWQMPDEMPDAEPEPDVFEEDLP